MIFLRLNIRTHYKTQTYCILWIIAALRAHSLGIVANGRKTLKR